MMKKQNIWIVNILIILIMYVFPLWVFHNSGNSDNIVTTQKVVFIILFFGGLILTVVNQKYYKETGVLKNIFIALGILGILYSLSVLGLIFSLRNGFKP